MLLLQALAAALALVPALSPTSAHLDQPAHSIDELRRAALAAKPGDRLELAAGLYEGSLWLERIRGAADNPITITAADPANPPIIRGDGECIHLAGCEWITLEHLVLEKARSNGLNIDDAGDLDSPARGITVRSVTVRDIGDPARDGNWDGIKLSGLADFTIQDCTIERWGGGGSGIDMVGCADGVITRCVLRHLENKGSSGIQAKGGTRDVTIEACRFDQAGNRAVNIGGSTGLAYFRPRPQGYEAARITLTGCTITGSEAALAFVGVDGASVTRCTIVRPRKWAIRILQETREPGFVPCRAGRLTDNIFVFDAPSVAQPNIGDATDPASFTFEHNLWYCTAQPDRSRPSLPSPETGGIYGQDPRLTTNASGDLTPAPDGPGANLGAPAIDRKSPDEPTR